MTSAAQTLPTTQKRPLVGYVIAALVALFLAFDTGLKGLVLTPAVQGTTQLGYPAYSVRWIGIIELACVVLYLIPRTAVLGALLLTGYLGGAVASQLRIGAPLLSHILFPIYVAALLWGAVYLRETRLHELLPCRR